LPRISQEKRWGGNFAKRRIREYRCLEGVVIRVKAGVTAGGQIQSHPYFAGFTRRNANVCRRHGGTAARRRESRNLGVLGGVIANCERYREPLLKPDFAEVERVISD
jgi:hypothetical protein